MKSLYLVERRANAVKADLVLIDAEVALSFLDLAELTTSRAIRERQRMQAAKAYQMVMERLPNVIFTKQQKAELDKILKKIRSRLPTVV